MSRVRAVKRTRGEWQAIVDEYRASNQTQAAFSTGRDFHFTTLGYWVKRLPPMPSVSVASDFIQIQRPEGSQTDAGVAVEMDASGRLRFSQLPAAEYLAALLAGVRSRC